MFSCEFGEISKNTVFYRSPLATAFDNAIYNILFRFSISVAKYSNFNLL